MHTANIAAVHQFYGNDTAETGRPLLCSEYLVGLSGLNTLHENRTTAGSAFLQSQTNHFTGNGHFHPGT